MPTPHGFVEKLAELVATGAPVVTVTLADATGSVPQEVGAKAIVTRDGLVFGTVGGGLVESRAIEHARHMLGDGDPRRGVAELLEWNLKRDVGMTCGGVVKLLFEVYNHRNWRIVLFGAGHVAAAIVQTLLPLECRITCIDPREEWLGKLPAAMSLEKVCLADMASHVATLPDDSFVLCLTMGHRTDRPILEQILRTGRRFPYLGVIGSKSKRAVLRRELLEAGISEDRVEDFRCPIGLRIGGNHPAEIALSVVAELLEVRDAWRRSAQA
jgi:xanthine dehydrogenase accessory factor